MPQVKYSLIFITLVILLCFLSFYPAFSFAFIVDDWFQLWGVFYDKSIIDYYILTQHPNSAYEFLALAQIFKFNPFYYQIVGFVLKIITSVSIALLAFVTTRSKKVAFFSGLLFASSVIGIETFTRISAHNSALLIPTLCLSMYFWIRATDKNKISYEYCLAIVFIALTIISDPGVGIIILPILFTWNLLELLGNFTKLNLRKFLIVNILLLIILISLKWYLDPRLANRSEPLKEHLPFILNHFFFTVSNFLTSIGNLIIGWTIPLKENMGLTTKNPVSTAFGYLFLLFTLYTGYAFIKKKSTLLMISFLFSVWIFMFYFPSWFTQGHYVKLGTISAVSNRYLAIPSIGLIIMISYLIASLKKYPYSVLLVLIVLNLISSFRILTAESTYRSADIQNRIYDKIDQDLPKSDEKNALIVFLGNDPLKIFGIEWNGFYPLAVKRNINQKSEFPTIVNTLEEAKNLVCKQKEKNGPDFKLSKLFAWKTIDQHKIHTEPPIINVSDQVRSYITSDRACEHSI